MEMLILGIFFACCAVGDEDYRIVWACFAAGSLVTSFVMAIL